MAEDDPDMEEDDVFKQYREKRLEELKLQQQRPRFGQLIEINRPMFEQEVNQAPKGSYVIISLYQD